MKKVFVIASFIAVSISAGFSQNFATRIDITAETGGFIEVGNVLRAFSGFTPVNMVASYGFNDHFSAGVGAGLNIYTNYDLTALPVFARFRANILKSIVTPFVQLDAGSSISLSSSDKYLEKNIKGFFITPAVGVSYRLKNSKALSLSIGCRRKNGRLDMSIPDRHIFKSGNGSVSLTILLGFTF